MAPQPSGYVDRDGRVHLPCTAASAGANGFCRELRRILNHFVRAPHHACDRNFYLSVDGPVANVRARQAPAGTRNQLRRPALRTSSPDRGIP